MDANNSLNSKFEDIAGLKNYISDLSENYPGLAVGAAFGAGLLLSSFGIMRLLTAGVWLKSQGFSLPDFKSIQAAPTPSNLRH